MDDVFAAAGQLKEALNRPQHGLVDRLVKLFTSINHKLTVELKTEQAEAKAERAAAKAELDAERATAKVEREKTKAELDAEREKAKAELDAERATAKAELVAEREKAKAELDAERAKVDAEREKAAQYQRDTLSVVEDLRCKPSAVQLAIFLS